MKSFHLILLLFTLSLVGCGDDSEPQVIERAAPEITDEQQDAMYDGDE
ncbi:hypothetical protein NHH03_09750 [Stieleria sp. TO1_6]|nr:hypothetical protein [Stieleria tagensis]MCO8122020.1 hypothetical protein [Stieleria tagensis]